MNVFSAVGTVMLAFAPIVSAAQGQQNIDELLARVGQRVSEFYNRAKSVICVETSTVQPIDASYSTHGFTRTVESELRIEIDGGQGGGEAAVVRKVRKVNGRAPREQDAQKRDGCTDPTPLSSEPLAFLLTPQRFDYQFKVAGTTKERDRNAVMIDFSSANRRSNPVLIEDPAGHENCFDWSGHIASRGRIWVDAETHDVLRLERGLLGPVSVKVPVLIQRRYHIDNWVVIVREDVTIRYNTIAFSDPDEVLLLPSSIDTLSLVRGGLQSTRRTQRYSEYRRFVTEGKVLH